MKKPTLTCARHLAGALLALVLSGLLAACGGGGTTDTTGVQLRPLSAEFSTRKAVAYSPYRSAANAAGLAAETIPEANIKQDLQLLQAAGFGLIRLFDSSDKVAQQTLEVIFKYALDIKVQLGVYVLSGDSAYNRAEVARAVALATNPKYRDIILGVSVGNETMVSWSFNALSPAEIAGYIRQVRSQITQPVTTDDNYAFWADAPTVITDVIDYASLHTYTELDTVYDVGLYDWKQKTVAPEARAEAMMTASITEARRQYALGRAHLDKRGLGAMPMVIGETGWNAVDLGRLHFRAHPVNQKMYLDKLAAWAAEGRTGNGPKAIVYFEAFDEKWKEGDDKWGLFNDKREARYAIQSLGTCNVTWVCEPGNYQPTDAVYYAVTAAVTASRYIIYSESATAADLTPTGVKWDPFVKTYWTEVADAAPGDGSHGLEVDPRPETWGWGMVFHSATSVTENLSEYAATGTINFSIKTSYAGKIEIGVESYTIDGDVAKAYLQIPNGKYGYCNNGNWCKVTIPLQDFLAVNPKLYLSLVTSRFVIADRYDQTGNLLKTGQPKIYLDGIYWAK